MSRCAGCWKLRFWIHLKGVRDRAILATLLYHGIRREELCKLCLGDIQTRQGVVHFRIEGKGDKIRFVPVHPTAQRLIAEYLEMATAKHPRLRGGRLGGEPYPEDPLFHPVKNNRTGTLDRPLDPGSIYRNIVRKYGRETGINAEVNGLSVHSMRATAATNALTNQADIAKGAGVAGACEYFDDEALRPAGQQARGQPDLCC